MEFMVGGRVWASEKGGGNGQYDIQQQSFFVSCESLQMFACNTSPRKSFELVLGNAPG